MDDINLPGHKELKKSGMNTRESTFSNSSDVDSGFNSSGCADLNESFGNLKNALKNSFTTPREDSDIAKEVLTQVENFRKGLHKTLEEKRPFTIGVPLVRDATMNLQQYIDGVLDDLKLEEKPEEK